MSKTDDSKKVLGWFNSPCFDNADLENVIIAAQNCNQITVDSLLLSNVILAMDHNPQKEDFWESLIPYLSSDSFNDSSLSYFYQNELGSIPLCHKQLPDKWLIKYSTFDDEPLFTLADRYRCDDCSKSKFVRFIETYVVERINLYEYMVTTYPYGEKWKLLIALGAKSCNFAIRKIANDHLACFMLSNTHDTEKIKEAYENHKADSMWLLSIAENPATPLDILQEMTSVSSIKFAQRIRNISSEMIKLITDSH